MSGERISKETLIFEGAGIELEFHDKATSAEFAYGKCAFCGAAHREHPMLSTCVYGPGFAATVRFCIPCLREVAGAALSAEEITR